MNARDDDPATAGLATGLRVTTIVVVVGTLLAIWSPAKHDPTTSQEFAPSVAASSAPTAGEPDMFVYFPSQFPAPTRADEPQPPTF